MSNPPKVSIIMSTFNGERYLSHALRSLLDQTFKDFQLIVVNDGSTDSTGKILRGFGNDRRLLILENDQNLGIAPSQNRALAAAEGEYVALQDHDDISLPNRLQVQVDFLDRNSEFSLIGSSSYMIDEMERVVDMWDQSADDLAAKWSFLFECPIFHTTAMIRRSILSQMKPYSYEYTFSCDYELFSRIAEHYKVFKLPQPLVKWRLHQHQTSFVRAKILREEAHAISRRNMAKLLGVNATINSSAWKGVELLLMMNAGSAIDISNREVRSACTLLLQVQEAFYQRYSFDSSSVKKHRQSFYRKLFRRLLALGYRTGNGKRNLPARYELLKWASHLFLLFALSQSLGTRREDKRVGPHLFTPDAQF